MSITYFVLVLASVRSTWPGRRETVGRQIPDIMHAESRIQTPILLAPHEGRERETDKRKRSGDGFKKNDKDVNCKGCMCDVGEAIFLPCPEYVVVAHNSRREHTSVADRSRGRWSRI